MNKFKLNFSFLGNENLSFISDYGFTPATLLVHPACAGPPPLELL